MTAEAFPDIASGFVIGLIAAAMTIGVWLLRTGYGEPPWVIISSVAGGYIVGIVCGTIVFLILLGQAFRPR